MCFVAIIPGFYYDTVKNLAQLREIDLLISVSRPSCDAATRELLAPIFDAATGHALAAERAFLAELDGSCRTPIAGYAQLIAGKLAFRGMVLREDGSEAFEIEASGTIAEAAALGAKAGRDLLRRLPRGVLR